MQAIDCLPLNDLVPLRILADQNIIEAQSVPNPQRKDQLKSSPSVQAKKRKYYWTPYEHRRYIKFLRENMGVCSLSINERKAKKVNHLMSKRVKTRNPAQCHTHHQKMLEKYKELPAIIQHHLHLLDLSANAKSDTAIIENSQEGKQANQIRQWKSVDQILMNSGLYEKVEKRSERLDRGVEVSGEEVDFFEEEWMEQREWIEW